jgi:DNA polymerase-3 subunit delta'
VLKVLERHPNAQTVLEPALAPDGAPSHAYLFHGPGGSGKREAARQVAAALLSRGAVDPASAQARALAGVHPDLTWVTPSGAHEILVSDIDEPVVAAAVRTPFEASRRVFVIESADQLGDEAANRLLKTLEEPPAYAHLILVSDRVGDVLETIRSRCQMVRFEGISVDQVVAGLVADGVAEQTAQAYARLGFGDAARARELAADEGVKLRQAAQALVRGALGDAGGRGSGAPWEGLLDAVRARGERVRVELETRRFAELEVTASRDRKRTETEWDERIKRGRRRVETAALELGLDVIEAWLLDLLAISYEVRELVRNRDRLGELQADARLAAGRDPSALLDAVGIVEDTRERFSRNVSEDLALEAMTYRLVRGLGGSVDSTIGFAAGVE